MMQSEFLSRRQREHARKERRAKLDRFMHDLSVFVLGAMTMIIIFMLAEPANKPFNLNKCDYLYPRDALERAPANWKEIDQTPEGNWCVTINR